MKMHNSITPERILGAVKSSMFDNEHIGFCVACGEEFTNIEPDLREGICKICKQPKVFGAESILPYLS
jgi:hypothetical protein